MPQVEIPAELFHEVEAVVNGCSTDEFVRAALREKLRREQLEMDERRAEFARLTAETRKAMEASGVTEEEIIADFEQWSREQRKQPSA